MKLLYNYFRKMKNSLFNLVLRKAFYRSRRTASSNTLGHVLIAGGTGFIGRNLIEMLLRERYKVTTISRFETGKKDIITWADVILQGIPDGITAVVNLAGAPLSVPFTYFSDIYKKEIFYSRIGSTWLLANIINCTNNKPNVFITVTSTDIYPPNKVHTEDFNFTYPTIYDNFYTKLGVYWEKPMTCLSPDVRWVSIRTGTVLGHNGIFMKWLNYNTNIGDGHQYQPWIHMCDLLYLILFSIENPQIHGILNGVSPKNITNHQLTATHAKIIGKSVKLNMPRTVLMTVFGIERTKLILEGRRVLPTKTLSYGFTFEYGEIENALNHLLQY